MALDEAAFRALLDPRGLLDASRPFALPPRETAFTVFSQRPDARIDVAEWARHAERFLGAKLGLTTDKVYEAEAPTLDVARVVLAPQRTGTWTESGARICWGRPRTEDDLAAAQAAEPSGAGLVELAARCPQVWLVEASPDDDRLALRLAAVVAGVLLRADPDAGRGRALRPEDRARAAREGRRPLNRRHTTRSWNRFRTSMLAASPAQFRQ